MSGNSTPAPLPGPNMHLTNLHHAPARAKQKSSNSRARPCGGKSRTINSTPRPCRGKRNEE
eukprot:6925160-Lingulodinium_polyedra.AAC.1